MIARKRREYLLLLDAAKAAAEAAVDAFNSVWHQYRFQTTLLLLANAWELLAKAVLIARKESIARSANGDTISGESAVHRLKAKGWLEEQRAETVQQVISLRNQACHNVLPDVPVEVMQHLLFFSCKFFRDLIAVEFPSQMRGMPEHYLSLSFADLTTYADRVQKAVARVKRSTNDKKLVWLLERGIVFDGSSYQTEAQFEQSYKKKQRVLPHLGLSRFLRKADMVRIVPVQAPRNFTADLTLRKGSAADATLPVLVKRTEVEVDYPYLTKELAAKLGRTQNWTARAIAVLGLKGQAKYHQAVRASKASFIQRYSQAALEALQHRLRTEPAFDPYGSA